MEEKNKKEEMGQRKKEEQRETQRELGQVGRVG